MGKHGGVGLVGVQVMNDLLRDLFLCCGVVQKGLPVSPYLIRKFIKGE